MKVTINSNCVLEDVKLKSHLEVENIQDVEIRDNARADLTKTDELERAYSGALADLTCLIARFLESSEAVSTAEEDNSPGILPDYVFSLSLSDRRGQGKTELIKDKMHSYLVNMAMSRFYVSVGQSNLAAARANLAASDGAVLVTALYSKREPTY